MRLLDDVAAPPRAHPDVIAQREAVAHAARPGRGRVEWSLVNGRTVPTRARANSPLKLLAPRNGGHGSWVFASTFGGGLLAGDHVDLAVAAAAGTACLLGTQASTKVYRSPAGVASRQTLAAAVDDGAVLVVAPDPVTCFAGAVFEQRQQFDLHAGGSLVLLDWLTSGRRATGERWQFDRYATRTDVRVDGRLAFRDAVLLDPQDGPLAGPGGRMGAFDCLAIVVLVGPHVSAASDEVLRFVGAQPVRRGEEMIFSASPLRGGGGCVLRVAGASTERTGNWLRERLSFVPALLGADPWARKF